MTRNTKLASGGLILGGLAAFAWYKYSRMSQQEKNDLVSGLKEKGQKLYDEYVPQNLKDKVKDYAAHKADHSATQKQGYQA